MLSVDMCREMIYSIIHMSTNVSTADRNGISSSFDCEKYCREHFLVYSNSISLHKWFEVRIRLFSGRIEVNTTA